MIYLDHAATTPVDKRVLDTMLPYFCDCFGNPSSIHCCGRQSREAVETAREQIATLIGAASPAEIVFTSGGTEADNLAIFGTVCAAKGKGRHIVTSKIEHGAVKQACKKLEHDGYEVTYLGVDGEGRVSPKELEAAIRPDTVLITIMHANNEIGTVQPIPELARIAKLNGIPFHTDAVQTVGKLPICVDALNVDLLSLSGHKIYGPKGIGALYVRKGCRMLPFQTGGEQERGRRGGTHNVPGIVGLGMAAALADAEMEEEAPRLARLRDRLIKQILQNAPTAQLTGSMVHRTPHNAHFTFVGVQGDALVAALDRRGVCASAGSACHSGMGGVSGAVAALGLPPERQEGSLRLTVGKLNDEAQIDQAVAALLESLRDLL